MLLTPPFTATQKSYAITDNRPHVTALHTIFQETFDPDYTFHGEVHDFWELVCVLEGRVSITVDHQVFTLEAGQAILHAPMQFHNIGSIGGSKPTVQVITFSGENIPPIHDRVCRIHDMSRTKAIYELALRAFRLDSLHWVVRELDDSNRPLRFAKELELLLLQLADHTQERPVLINRSAEQYSRIVKTMEENLHRRLSAEELAHVCRISKVGMQKIFARYAGVGVMEYYHRLRMRAAADMLAAGASVKETALAVGFADQNYFSTVFKRVTGQTPSQCRKKES